LSFDNHLKDYDCVEGWLIGLKGGQRVVNWLMGLKFVFNANGFGTDALFQIGIQSAYLSDKK